MEKEVFPSKFIEQLEEALMAPAWVGVGGWGGAWPWSYTHRPSHTYFAGTEHVGFQPIQQILLSPRAKRRNVLGEWHEE